MQNVMQDYFAEDIQTSRSSQTSLWFFAFEKIVSSWKISNLQAKDLTIFP